MAKKCIGILTGGGDVPGLNSVIKSVVYRAAELGCEVPMYNTDRYRPKYDPKLGLPIFLTRP